MLAAMRKGIRTIFAKIILGFLILSFAVWGVGDVARNHGQNANVATIGSRGISLFDFERDVRMQEDIFKQRLGAQYNPQILVTMGIPQQILARKINQELFALEAEHLGLIPSDTAVAEAIRNNPEFRGLVGFEKEKFQSYLKQTGQSEAMYVKSVKRDIGIKLLFATYDISPTPSETMVKLAEAVAQETREVAVYTIPQNALKPIPAPTTEQLTATYQMHAQQFVAAETREASIAVIEKSSEELLVEASHKLEDLLAGGATFHEAAQEVGAVVTKMPAIKASGVTPAGTKAALPKLERLLETVFTTEAGTESNVINGGGGKMYVVHVNKVNPQTVPALEAIRSDIEDIWRKDQTSTAYSRLAEDIATRFQQMETRSKVIAEYGLTPRTEIIKRTESSLPDSMAAELFSLKAGASSSAAQTARGTYVVVVVQSIPAASVPSYNAKSPQATRLKSELQDEQLELLIRYLRGKYKVTVNEEIIARMLEPQS